jgi:hypothetical protein
MLLSVVGFATPAVWALSSSTDYEFEESALGGLGPANAITQSTNYQAAESGGILGVGNSSDSGFQIKSGHTTTNDPALSFGINSYSANFGFFSPTSTATATASFEVLDYTSYGYVVQTAGTAPSNGTHTISAMGTTAAPVTGTEQFGMNLVANTVPTSFGANPNHGQFGVGSASSNYATTNEYRYVSGDTIASAPQSSGMTVYTISYIADVSSITPAGIYNSNQTIICTGTY